MADALGCEGRSNARPLRGEAADLEPLAFSLNRNGGPVSCAGELGSRTNQLERSWVRFAQCNLPLISLQN
jgi:hypothetical protein